VSHRNAAIVAGPADGGPAQHVSGLGLRPHGDALLEGVEAGDVLVQRRLAHPEAGGEGRQGELVRPTSSAISAATVTTRSVFSPALGTSGARSEEGEHERNHLVGELFVWIVPGALDHLKATEAGWQAINDRRTLGVRVGPVGVERAHHD
jgi:hypothetical protein